MESKDIWVFAEQENGILSETVYELLAEAQKLRKSFGGEVAAVLLGCGVSSLTDTLAAYGADKIILAESGALAVYKPRTYTNALSGLAKKYAPSIFLLGATAIGRDVAPRVMCALRTGLTADAVDLSADADGDFVQTTPGFGGNLLAHICIPEKRPQMVTVRPGVFSPSIPDNKAYAPVIREALNIADDADYEILETVEKSRSGPSLSDAKIVVACGRGIKSSEDIKLAETLAARIGGVVACSRPIAESGWMPHERQIGQSGATVKADYIINIGISGAMQYLSGMQNSKCVISINTNPTASIFDVSQFGAVCDYRKLLPAIIKRLR